MIERTGIEKEVEFVKLNNKSTKQEKKERNKVVVVVVVVVVYSSSNVIDGNCLVPVHWWGQRNAWEW